MYKLEDDLLKKLRCVICNNYLSVAPVVLTRNGKNICGRCVQNQKENEKTQFHGSRNNIYEQVISIMKFPCQYNDRGCKESFVSTHIREHEQNCEFRIYKCPMFYTDERCNWIGQRNEIRKHFIKEHPDLIAQYPCQYKPPVDEDIEHSLLMTMCGFNFLLQVKVDCDSGKIWHRVRFLGEPYLVDLFSFSLEIKGLNCSILKTSSIQMNEQFVLKDCMVTNIASLREILGKYETLTFKIRIVMNNTKKSDSDIKKNVSNENNSETEPYEINSIDTNSEDSLLSESKSRRNDCGDEYLDDSIISLCGKLKCSKCQGYLSYGPVMMTINDGLNICGRCYENIKDKKSMVRNEIYELVASFIQYPCQFDKQGCRKILSWNTVEEHERHCYYATFQCPVMTDGKLCSWLGCKDSLKTHFVQYHPTDIVENPCLFKPDIHYLNESHFLICAFGLTFILQVRCLGARSKIYHRVYCLGEKSMTALFKYVLDMKSPVGILQKSKNVHFDSRFSPDDCLETDIEGLLLVLGPYDEITFQISILMKSDDEENVKNNEKDTPSNHRILSEAIQGIKSISINYPKSQTSQKIEIKFNKSSKLNIKPGMIPSGICELERELTFTIPKKKCITNQQSDEDFLTLKEIT